jgi:hypothetical protein
MPSDHGPQAGLGAPAPGEEQGNRGGMYL